MSIISFEFLMLVLITFAFYYFPLFKRHQVHTFILSSLVFYGWDQYKLLPQLILTVLVTYYSMLGAMRGSKLSAALGILGISSLISGTSFGKNLLSN